MSDISQILITNGFKYRAHPMYSYEFIVEDLEIVHLEPMVEHIEVNCIMFTIHITFIGDVPYETNFGLNFDVDGYQSCGCRCIFNKFFNENDFINELHRLNTIGSNIKG